MVILQDGAHFLFIFCFKNREEYLFKSSKQWISEQDANCSFLFLFYTFLLPIPWQKLNWDLSLCGSDPSHEQCAGFLRSAGWRSCEPDCVLWRRSWDQRGHRGSPSHWQWREPGNLVALPLRVSVKEEEWQKLMFIFWGFFMFCVTVPSRCQSASQNQSAAPVHHG